MEKIDKAKQLFFENNGIKHWMWYDGYIDEYNSFHVTKDQEMIWYKELQEKKIEELKNGIDPNMVMRQMEAIASEINVDTYLKIAIDLAKRIFKQKSSNVD